MKKRLLICSTNVDWGGSEILWAETVNYLKEYSAFEIFIFKHSNLVLPVYLTDSNQIFVLDSRLTVKQKFANNINKILPHCFRIVHGNNFKHFLNSVKPDLVLINQGLNFNGVDLMEYCFEYNYKYATLSHAVSENFWPSNKLRRKMKSGFRNAIMNYFVSNDNLMMTEIQLAQKIENSTLVKNPLSIDINDYIDYPDFEDNINLACVGRIHFSSKGQDVLLNTLNSSKWKNRNLVVNFYGTGPDIENLLELISLYDLKNVNYLGYQNPGDIWRKNHALILTSRYEGLPIVILEAMMAGRIVIATDVSGNIEVFEHNTTGFVIPAPRVKYVDNILEHAWESKKKWKAMGLEARKSISMTYPSNPAKIFADNLLKLISLNDV